MFFWNSLAFSMIQHPTDVGNLISGSSAFSKTSLNIWKFTVHILLKPTLVLLKFPRVSLIYIVTYVHLKPEMDWLLEQSPFTASFWLYLLHQYWNSNGCKTSISAISNTCTISELHSLQKQSMKINGAVGENIFEQSTQALCKFWKAIF